MPFPARFSGKCCKCSGSINVGQLISWNRKEKGKVYHVNCNGNFPIVPAVPVTTGNEPIIQEANIMENQEVKQEEEKTVTNENESNDALKGLALALKPYIGGLEADVKQIKKTVDETLEDFKKNYNPPVVIIKNESTGKEVKIEGAHEKLSLILKVINTRNHNGHRLNVYIYGPAGSGKSTLTQHIRDAVFGKDKTDKWGYTSLNPQSPESRILGYKDAKGDYQASEFRRFYENGGVYCIDEMDNAHPALMTTLNSMLENGHGAFPDGTVPRHPDFILVCCGNTNGNGGNVFYPERRAFDTAFKGRFIFVEVEYDENLENTVSGAISKEWSETVTTWIQKARKYCLEQKIKLVVSPRENYNMLALLESGIKPKEVIEIALFKGLDKGTKDRIIAAVGLLN